MSVVDTAKTIGELVKKGATLELQKTVVQLREEALELQEENLRLKRENLKLKEQIELQKTVYFRKKVYWRDGDEVPFCPYCFEKSHLLIHIGTVDPRYTPGEESAMQCPECASRYRTSGEADFTINGPARKMK